VCNSDREPARHILTFDFKKEKRAEKKRKEIFYVKANSFRNMSHNNYQKNFNSDHRGSFGTVPSPLLREYLTSNGAI